MGSSLSTASRSVARQSSKRISASKPAAPSSPTQAQSLSESHQNITAGVQKQQPIKDPVLYQRPTTDDWATALKQMSNVITSSSWDANQTSAQNSASGRHPAQRSSATAEKLPQQRSKMDADVDDAQLGRHGTTMKPKGRLSQVDVLELFRLRRQGSEQWNEKSLSNKYKVDERDLADLLKFTRTYAGRLDNDGKVRAYYNPDPSNTIKRFEKD